VKKEEQTKLLQ